MSQLKTIHANIFNIEEDEHVSNEKLNLSKIISNTVDELLKNSSDLLVDVENKIKDRKILEGKIIEISNTKNLNIDDRNELIEGVLNYLFDYGKIQPLIEDDDVTDIDFVRYNRGTVKRNGKKELLQKKYLFASEKEFNRFAKTLIIRNSGIINENYSHERVSDERYKLRINVSIPPRNMDHTSVNIRKHRQNPYNLNDLLSLGMFDEKQRKFLEWLITNKKKFVLAGKGASGKTTLMRAMFMNADPLDTYLVTEKDTELYFSGGGFIQQRIKKENHGGIPITLGDLVKDGLTMSLDGYVVGEIVGDEAWHFINAGVTDHMIAGTLHSNNVLSVPHRFTSLIQTYNPGLKTETIMELIANSIEYVIHLSEFKITEIGNIVGYDRETNVVKIDILNVGDLNV